MALEEISFNHWFTEVKESIPEYMIKTINPYIMKFFKADKVYFATSASIDGSVEVNSTIGNGPTGFRDFLKACKLAGIDKLTFGCSDKNIVVQTLYRYVGANKTQEIKNYYSDGSNCYRYELKISESKRLKNL